MKNTQRFLFTPELIAQCEEDDILALAMVKQNLRERMRILRAA